MKTKMRFHFQPIRLTNSRIETPKVAKGIGEKKHTHILMAEEKLEGNWQYVSKGLKILKPRNSPYKTISQDKHPANVQRYTPFHKF